MFFRLIPSVRRGAFLFLLGAASSLPAHAQKGGKGKNAVPVATGPQRLQPLYGGLGLTQAQQAVGPAVLADVDRSFPSRPEASKFFSNKGFEYLQENQPDTATVRFNLAWVLDPKNPEPYRGLAVLLSRRPDASPEAIQALVLQGLAVAPTNAPLLTDAANTTLARYEQSKKKKDLQQASDYVQRALLADSTNANAWQTQARIHYYQENYAEAWKDVRKGQNLSLTSLDFQFLTELMAKLPDPEGKFK
ncbi:MAG: tetratricopeptide repeat protein [Janthinobacterium lividum]